MPSKKKRNRDSRDLPSYTDPQQRRVMQAKVEASVTQGPLPPPEILVRYSEVVQDGAERIMVMAEKQNDHRIALEGEVIREDIRRQRWGLGLGFVVAVVGLAAAAYIAVYAHAAAGAAVAALDLVGLAGVFVYGSRGRRSEREERAELMTGRR